MTTRKITPQVAFWHKVARGKEDECWEWQACLTRGYGYFYADGTNWRAHRYAWYITHGSIPNNVYVLHKCDNPQCVNPNHLFLGNQSDNMLDASNKRHWVKRKRINAKADLTIKKRNGAIKLLYATGRYTMLELAQLVKISESSISLIISEKHTRNRIKH